MSGSVDITGAPLGGTAIAPDGTPLPGAMVEVWCAHAGTEYLATDDAGRWLAPAVRAGPYEVRAGAAGYARGPTLVGTHDGRTPRLDLVARTSVGARLFGRVCDAAGVPVGDAHVYTGMHPGDERSATTDADGRFEVRGLSPGRHYVGVATWRSSVLMPGDGEELELAIALPAPASAPSVPACVALRQGAPRLATPATLTGRVLRDGAPVSHFAIVRKGKHTYPWIAGPDRFDAADGRFTLTEVDAPSCTVHVIALGTAWADTPTLELAPGATIDLGDIALVAGDAITGIVRDARGAPVPGATVVLGSRTHATNDALEDAVEGYFETTSVADGTFTLAGVHVRERHVRLAAHHPDHGASLEQGVADTAAPVELVLLATGAIDGDATDIAMYACVILRGDGPELPTRVATVRPSGAFAFEGLVPGAYTIELVQRPGWPLREARTTVIAGERARVRMPPP